jgi:arabinofuranosyltransferase
MNAAWSCMTAELLEDTAARPSASDSASRSRQLLQRGLMVVPVALFALAGWAHRWMVDDGFIYLRVVQQITSGNGPVFNTGERVEAFTSPLWVALLTVADILTPVRLEWIAVWLGIGLSAAGLGLAMAGSASLVRRTAPAALLVPFGALVPLALIPVWIFQTSGLENGLVMGWLGACLFVLAWWATSGRRMPWYGAALIGLGWLVRPELVQFSALFLVMIVVVEWSHDTWGDRLRIVGAALALPVLYQLFRMGYYGSLFSNPAIAKEASNTNWGRGWDYLVDFVSPYWLWVPALAVAVGGYLPLVSGLHRSRARRPIAVAATFVVAGLGNGIFVVAVGGDWLHARLLLPAVFALVAPVAVIPLSRRYAAGVLLVPWALIAAFALRPQQLDPEAALTEPFILANARNRGVTIDDFGLGEGGPSRRWYVGPAYYYSHGLAPPRRVELNSVRPSLHLPVAALGGIGGTSYAIGPELQVIDTNGLASTLAAHMIAVPPPSDAIVGNKPGHEKPLPSVWVAALVTPLGARPDPAGFPPQPLNPAIPPTTGNEFQEQVAWARAALDCPDIRELLQSTTGSFGARRAVRNLVGSFERTRLRIPPDPKAAYRKFCGTGTPDDVKVIRGKPE